MFLRIIFWDCPIYRTLKGKKPSLQGDLLSLSLRCGCPVDTSAKQKHRPSRQARPPQGVRQSVFPLLVIANAVRRVAIRSFLRGITDSFALCAQNDKQFNYCKYIRRADKLSLTRHCERRKACGNPFSFKGNYGFFRAHRKSI